MSWRTINTKTELEELAFAIDWSDAEVCEFYGSNIEQSYYPSDTSRTGYSHKNIHMLLMVNSTAGKYLELAFLHCDHFDSFFLQYPDISHGRIDSLKRVEILDSRGSAVRLRASRFIYRYRAETEVTTECYLASEFADDETR